MLNLLMINFCSYRYESMVNNIIYNIYIILMGPLFVIIICFLAGFICITTSLEKLFGIKIINNDIVMKISYIISGFLGLYLLVAAIGLSMMR